MGHCSGGEGPDIFDKMSAITDWVEKSQAPEKIIASKLQNGQVQRTRPLCVYPAVAKWNGAGNLNDSASFSCAAR